jgi:hypothetical protein
MNEREKVYYFLGTLNDFSRDDAIKSIKEYSKLSLDEINQIIEDIISFNDDFKKQHSE